MAIERYAQSDTTRTNSCQGNVPPLFRFFQPPVTTLLIKKQIALMSASDER